LKCLFQARRVLVYVCYIWGVSIFPLCLRFSDCILELFFCIFIYNYAVVILVSETPHPTSTPSFHQYIFWLWYISIVYKKSKLYSFQLHAYIHFCFFPHCIHCINNSHKSKILISMHIYFCDICMFFIGNRFKKSICLFPNPIVQLLLICLHKCQLYQ